MKSKPIPASCPYCTTALRAVAMECPACGVEVRGRFRQTFFQMLDADEQALLEEYLLADFSIKELAQRSGMGYAAIRTRLDRLIGHYRRLRDAEDERKAILERVGTGELTAAEAAQLIAGLDGDGRK